MRSWNAKGQIDTRGFLFKKPFSLGNCTVYLEKERMNITVDLQESDEIELEAIEKLALIEAKKACKVLSLATGRFFAFRDFDNVIETTPSAKRIPVSQRFQLLGMVVVPELKPSEQKEAINVFRLLENADPYALKAIDYFEKAVALSNWNEDAFLNFFKAIELISKKHHMEAVAHEIRLIYHKPKKELTTKEKMLFMCRKLNLPSQWSSKIRRLVDLRNKQDVAHARLTDGQISTDDVHNCEAIAKLVIVSYLRKSTQSS